MSYINFYLQDISYSTINDRTRIEVVLIRSCAYGLVPFLFETWEVIEIVRVERISGTILRVEQEMRRNSQLRQSIYWLSLMILERESKLKDPWI